MRIAIYVGVLILLILTGCNGKPSLQQYFVEKSEEKGFVVVDLSPSIINVDKAKLTPEQKTALGSFDKMNILAFKLDATNQNEFDSESKKVMQMLKEKEYQELMKMGSGKDAASVSYVGDEDHINEFVFFAKKKENGFVVVRVMGNDMNPNNIMNMISVLQSSNLNLEQLKPLQGLLTK